MKYRFFIVFLFVILFIAIQYSRISAANASDWEFRCAENEAGEIGDCEIFQRLVDNQSQLRVAEIAVSRNYSSNQYNVALILPLGVHIPSGVKLGIDGKLVGTATISHCEKTGCVLYAQMPEGSIIQQMKTGMEFNVSFKNVAGKEFLINFSLKGFGQTLKNV